MREGCGGDGEGDFRLGCLCDVQEMPLSQSV